MRNTDRSPKNDARRRALCLVACVAGVLAACGKFDHSKITMPEFEFVTTENLHGIACAGRGRLWACGNYGTILVSGDGGATWSAQQSGLETTMLGSIACADARHVWAAGVGGTIVHTRDGGETWISQVSGTERNLLDLFFLDRSRGWAVGEFGTIIGTTDGGVAWHRLSDSHDTIFNDVRFVDARSGWVVGEFGTILHTADGGATWQPQHCAGIVPPPDESGWDRPLPALYGLWFTGPDTGWIVGMDGVIMHTTDGGATWERLDSPSARPLYSVCVQGRQGWIVGNKGVCLQSHDGGLTWQLREDALKTKFWLREALLCGEDAGVIVGERGTIARTVDGGATWEQISGFRYDMEEFGLTDF